MPADIPRLLSPQDEESIRWYLEEYRKFPFEPASTIARNTAARLKQLGEQLFDQLFRSTAEGRNLWAVVEERIEETRFDIANDPSRFTGPWEILWNPLDVMPAACRAASFVRTSSAPVSRETPDAGDVIRILLVISRPAGILDAPFRSVAARLLERVAEDPRFRFEVLRPPTLEAFQRTLQAAADQGRPYTVVHFDGHGVHEDRMAARENRPAKRQRGYLLFESPSDSDRPDYIDAPRLGEALAAGRAPILILNACRSARAEKWTEQMGNRRPLGSLADELLRLGQPAVLAMQYNVEVETASRFVADLYQGLADGRSLAEAVQNGRRNLFMHSGRARADGRVTMHEWLVPVLFETSPLSLLQGHSPPVHHVPPTRKASLPATAVGGDDTLMAIERAFQSVPVVVLAGPVGSGKTTLAADFAAWDERTRDQAAKAHSRLHILEDAGKRSAEETAAFERALQKLVAEGSRALIPTRASNFSLAVEHAVVHMSPLDLPESVVLMQQKLPDGTALDAEPWQSVFAFAQGNPGVLLDIATRPANAQATNPTAILEIARSQPVGLDPQAFATALSTFDRDDMGCLAIATLFEGPVSSRTLRLLASAGSELRPSREDADSAFDCLCELGLATPLGSSYYQMHPGLPGLLRPEFERLYAGERGQKIRGAIVTFFAAVCAVFCRHGESGQRDAYELAKQTLGLIEPTIWRVLEQAIAVERWPDVRNLAGALRLLLVQQGRHVEWRRLADRLQSLVANDANDEPRAGRESVWHLLLEDRIERLIKLHSLALKLASSGEGTSSYGKAFATTIGGLVVMVLGGFLLFKSGNSAVLAVLAFVLTLVAALIARTGWGSLGSTLIAYAFAARIPVLIVMYFAMRGGWGTHYDAVEARFVAAPLGTKFFYEAFLPQMMLWIGYTVVVGSLFGEIVAVIFARKPVVQPAS